MLDQDKHMQWGRLAGLLLLVQLLGGIFINFSLYGPLFSDPGFLVKGADYANQVGWGALISLDMSAVVLLITLFSYKLFKEAQLELTMALLVFATIALATTIMESISMMTLVSYSEAYVAAEANQKASLEAGRVIVASIRNWTHYMAQITAGSAFLVFYLMLLVGRFVPRLLAWFGVLAAFLQIIAVASVFVGFEINFALLAPIALANLIHGLWLLTKGYAKA